MKRQSLPILDSIQIVATATLCFYMTANAYAQVAPWQKNNGLLPSQSWNEPDNSWVPPMAPTQFEPTPLTTPQFSTVDPAQEIQFDPSHDFPKKFGKNAIREIDLDPRSQFFIDDLSFGNSVQYNEYRAEESFLSYMPGNGEHFGWIDLESTPYLQAGKNAGLTGSINIHWLGGPNSSPLPPRLYDFILGYQMRDSLSDRFSYDMAANVGIYSDFEDSARDGVRALAHAVGMVHYDDRLDMVFGIDYLCRDDIKLLPVIGYSWHNPENPAWRFDMVFPRPRINYTVGPSKRLYVSGLMGGGTWDIEMPGDVNDVMTYKDLRILFGYERLFEDGSVTALEMGVVFDRQLTFRMSDTSTRFDDAFIIRFVSRR